MKRFLLIIGVAGVFLAVIFSLGWFDSNGSVDVDQQSVVSIEHFVNLTLDSATVASRSLAEIDRQWHPGSAMMLVEVLRFVRLPSVFEDTLALLERRTGKKFGDDFNEWHGWLWSRKYNPHPHYAQLKSALYSNIDRRFSEHFVKTDNATIRLDEIVWGGVVRDGIVPLKNPKMIPAKDARYLADSNVVFGVILNGDARCYPKRILAWHEMFKDTIGTVPVCGAY